MKFTDFQQITRGRTVVGGIEAKKNLGAVSGALLEQVFPITKGIRLLGLTLSNLGETRSVSERQMSLTI